MFSEKGGKKIQFKGFEVVKNTVVRVVKMGGPKYV